MVICVCVGCVSVYVCLCMCVCVRVSVSVSVCNWYYSEGQVASTYRNLSKMNFLEFIRILHSSKLSNRNRRLHLW